MSAGVMSIDGSDHQHFHKPKLDYLRELSGGDNQFVTEILEMFIQDAPQAITQARDHFHQNNFDLLRITVHKLKSSVQVVGGYHLTSLIHEIESAATGGKSELYQMLSGLERGIQQLVNHLYEELQSLSSGGNAA